MLRTLLIPGKVPSDTLKPKQRMEALALEKDVYKVLELTPRNGKEFCRAIREVLERETTWVSWKKGGAAFGGYCCDGSVAFGFAGQELLAGLLRLHAVGW